MKVCKKCNNYKIYSDFNKSKDFKDGYYPVCRYCVKMYAKKWRNANKEKANGYGRKYNLLHSKKHREASKKWQRLNPDKYKNISLKRTHKINISCYNNMLKQQNYSCAICKKHKKNFNINLSVDHCHKTGKIRGLLCSKCNTGIGFFNESKTNFINAIKYLNKSKR